MKSILISYDEIKCHKPLKTNKLFISFLWKKIHAWAIVENKMPVLKTILFFRI